jgi:hypothetical protein
MGCRRSQIATLLNRKRFRGQRGGARKAYDKSSLLHLPGCAQYLLNFLKVSGPNTVYSKNKKDEKEREPGI